MSKPFKGVTDVDVRESVPDWEPYTQPIAPEGSPNVVYVVLDDAGFSAMEPFGGLIDTPNLDRVAARGLTYTNFHTTALCSPTRACLMTGRNHTTNGMARITEAASTHYIASGGDRDFMRPVTEELYAIPSERVIGSSNALQWTDDEHGGMVRYRAAPDVFDDGPVKPVRIWSRIGRRPILAAGNSNGDIPMLRYAGGPARPALRLLVLHDDDEREFAYTGGAERALEQAAAQGWTVASIKRDWAAVFPD